MGIYLHSTTCQTPEEGGEGRREERGGGREGEERGGRGRGGVLRPGFRVQVRNSPDLNSQSLKTEDCDVSALNRKFHVNKVSQQFRSEDLLQAV